MANQWRELFSRALNPEVDWTIPDLEELVESFSASITEGEPPLCGTDEDIRLAIRSTFESTQPMAAVLGATLHSLSAPDVFEDTTHLRLLALYAEDVGVGVPNSGRYEWFHQTMREVGFAEECLSRIELVQGSSAPDACFAAPATLLALSRRPDEYAFELLGIDLCFRSVGLLAPWAWVRELTLAGQWDRLDLTHSTNGNSHDLDTLAREIVGGSCADPARVARGQDLGERLLRQWGSAVFAHTRRRLDPRLAMADLLSSRAREAGVYHQHSRLADRSLASWFATAPRDSLDFVDRLAGSRYVRPGDPLRSPLLTRLTAFGGPMFRIFSSEDEQVLSRWITSLAETGPLVPAATQQCQDEAAVPAPPMRSPSPGADAPAPQNLREAYARLTTRSASATATEFARQYVAQWLTPVIHDSGDRVAAG
jgi:hypothetical protein